MSDFGKVFLCRPDFSKIGVINGINENTALLTESISDPWELTFEVNRYTSVDGEIVETDYYQSLNEWMFLYLQTYDDKESYFIIDVEPEINIDGNNEIKNVTAHSLEVELQSKYLRGILMNTGTTGDQNTLIGYYDNDGVFHNKNLNPYTNLPIEYLTVYNRNAEKLTSVLDDLISFDLSVDTSNGLITYNQDAYEYLFDIYQKYPRLICDVQDDGSDKIYLNVIDNPNAPLGYDIYVGHDFIFDDETNQYNPTPEPYSVDYLLNGIRSLISYYEQYKNQLSILSLAFELAEASGWSVGDVPERIANKKYSFNIDGTQDLLSFFKTTFTQTAKVIVDFDKKARKINIIDVQDENAERERDTGVFISYHNLLKEVNVSSQNEDGLKTQFVPTGANNLGILYVNFGEDKILNLDWLINKVNEYGDYQYVSSSLHDKYRRWISYREEEPITLLGVEYPSRRDAYRELTKLHNQKTIDINEIKNRLPADACFINYLEYSFEELNIVYKAMMNALESLEKMYMCDYGVYTINRTNQKIYDYNGNEITEEAKQIRNTWYWWDWDAYVNYIIPNISNALLMYVYAPTGVLDATDPLQMDQATGDWIYYPGGNPWYIGDATRVTENASDAYLYDMSLYGTTELKAKQTAWREVSSGIYKIGFVLLNGVVIDPIPPDGYTYNTPDETGWNKVLSYFNTHLNVENPFTTQAAYEKALNEYLDYVSPDVRTNSLTKMESKGLIHMCQDAIDALQPSIDVLVNEQNEIQNVRKQLANDCLMDNWNEFTEKELETLYTLIKQADYSNNNILTTNLDDIVTTVDAQEELYQDAKIALSEKAQVQLSFELEMDNLFALKDFEPLKDSVDLLRFIRVSIGLYDNEFTKLRIITISRNPLIPAETLEVKFSNMTYSLQGLSDLASLFDSMNGGSNSGNGGSGGNSSGTYGQNDAEIQIANNMLSALLRSKQYTNSVGHVIMEQIVNREEYRVLVGQSGLFEKFESGEVKVSGDCIFDYIKSSNYKKSITSPSGSYLNLKDGTFNYGAGSLIYEDSKLKIKADKVEIQGNDISNAYKTATNYLTFNPGNGEHRGLIISRDSSLLNYDYNTQITESEINIRFMSKILASFSGAGVSLYQNGNLAAQFTNNGMDIYDSLGTTSLAHFGTTTRIGSANSYHTNITNNGFQIWKGAEKISESPSLEIKADGVYINGELVLSEEDIEKKIDTAIQGINFSSSLKVVLYKQNISTFSGNKRGYITIDNIDGWSPVGVVGFDLSNHPSDGHDVSHSDVRTITFQPSKNKIKYEVNTWADSAKLKISIKMLYAEDVSLINDYTDDEDEDEE